MNEENIEIKNKSAMAVASLPLGIISIILNLFWYISLPTGILAIIFGTKTIKRFGSKIGKAGLVTGIVGESLCVFAYISAIILILIYEYM